MLERSFPLLWVSGELSNLTRAASGHWYFTLKDAQAAVRAVMFRGRNQSVGFAPANGDRVEVRVQVGLYEPRGEFQLNVEAMRRSGAGDLFAQFLRLKAQLATEGLFDEDRKRELPAFPRAVGVVTSPKAAALRDVLTTLARRAPQVPVILYPASVQGAQAPGELLAALRAAGRRAECDVVLLVRGGGAIEDLWAFNDEALAREIAACPVPVISGVGHETDFTIADFIADARAPTPTGAATLAVPDRLELLDALGRERHRLIQAWGRQSARIEQRLDLAVRLLRPPSLQWAQRAARLEQLSRRLGADAQRALQARATRLTSAASRLRVPDVSRPTARIDALERAAAVAMARRVDAAAARVGLAASALELVSPAAVLERGYAIVTDSSGAIVREASRLAHGTHVSVSLARGAFGADVTDLDPQARLPAGGLARAASDAEPKSADAAGTD
jgi:exodeoxyribonuclease VII large subunit